MKAERVRRASHVRGAQYSHGRFLRAKYNFPAGLPAAVFIVVTDESISLFVELNKKIGVENFMLIRGFEPVRFRRISDQRRRSCEIWPWPSASENQRQIS